MIFALLGFVSCTQNPKRLCLKTAGKSTNCALYEAKEVSTIQDSDIKDGMELFIDSAVTLSFDAFSKLRAVTGIGLVVELKILVSGNKKLTTSLLLNKIDLKIAAVPSSGIHKLLSKPINQIIFNNVSLFGTGTKISKDSETEGFTIKRVKTDDIALLTSDILNSLDESGASINITIDNLDTLKWESNKIFFGKSTYIIELADTRKMNVFITSYVSGADKKLTITATDGPSHQTYVLVVLTVEKKEKSDDKTTFKLEKGGSPNTTYLNWNLRLRMITDIGDYPLNMSIWDLVSKMFLVVDGERLMLPETGDKYCIAETGIPAGKCEDGIHLLSANEIKLAANTIKFDLIQFNLFGFSENSMKVNISDIQYIDTSFISMNEEPSCIKLFVDDENVGQSMQKFTGIKLELVLKKNDFSFGNLVLANVTYPTKVMKTAEKEEMKSITSKVLKSDIKSLNGLISSVSVSASDSFILNEPNLLSLKITKNGIIVTDSSNIVVIINESLFKDDVVLEIGGSPTFKYEKITEGEAKIKTLNIVMTKSNLSPTLSGDGWEEITINIETNADSGKFEGKTNEGAAVPKFIMKGDGRVSMNGVEIEKSNNSNDTTAKRGILSGGTAGIVIACIVVIASIVAVILIVIKKRKT